jgi:hypothetical protein
MPKYTIKKLDGQISREPCLIPRHPFQLLINAPIASGKSTLLINLLINSAFFAGFFDRIVLFSPTFNLDEKWVKAYNVNNVLRKPSRQHGDETIDLSDGPNTSQPRFTGRMDLADVHLAFDHQELKEILDEQEENLAAGKYRLLVMFEDCIGLDMFSGKNRKIMEKLATILRHLKVSVIYCSQSYKLIPRTIRTNLNNLIIFDIKNTQERKKIHEEYPCIGDFKRWQLVYEQIIRTGGDHAFIHMNFQNNQRYQVIQNFDHYVDVE